MIQPLPVLAQRGLKARGRGLSFGRGRGPWVTLWLGILVLFLSWGVSNPGGAMGEGKGVKEYELKAALVTKLPLFIEWPAKSWTQGETLTIGILGENPFGDALVSATSGKKVGGHPIQIITCRDISEALRCQIVFVAEKDPKLLRGVFERLASANVLTVGDAAEFATTGGMVGLISANQRVALEVNPQAIQSAGLRVDPQLLQLAKVIRSNTPK